MRTANTRMLVQKGHNQIGLQYIETLPVIIGLSAVALAFLTIAHFFPPLQIVSFVVVGCIILFSVLRWPSSPILVIYPITWVLGAYNVGLVGGRVERIIAILGLVGALVSADRFKRGLPLIPGFLKLGIAIILGAYLISWFAHPDLPEASEVMISLASRFLFLMLVVYHVKSEGDLRLLITVFIVSTFIACIATFWIGIEYGFGYIRDYELNRMVKQSVDPLIETISRNMNQATAAGVLLIGFYPYISRRRTKVLLTLAVLFIFWMAFAAEFRREILITIPIVLGYLYFDKRSGLSKLALPLLFLSTFLFLLVLLPESPILQERLEKETPNVLERKESRMVSFATGLTAFIEGPVIGHGPSSYASVIYPRLPYDADPIARGAYNVFIWIAVEAGFIGLIGVIMVVMGSYAEARRLRPLGTQYADIVVRLGPLFVVLIFVWFSFGNAWDASIPWFLIGLILAVRRMGSGNSAGVAR